MILGLTFLLLPVAATCGWYVGRQEQEFEDKPTNAHPFSDDYFKGLNYLINEQPDKAVDVFIKLLEVDSDTVEMHLALGNLFRRRGEVDRAIRVHQNLIARPQLDKAYRIQALSALGQDYLNAGVLDRAERIFQELGEDYPDSLRYLLSIYQREKDWPNAILSAEKWQSLKGEPMGHMLAQFYCEMAEEAELKGNASEAFAHLEKARLIDPACVRVSILLGRLESRAKNYHAAIAHYQRVRDQDADYLSEIVEPLFDAYKALGQVEKCVDYLGQCLDDKSPIKSVIIVSNHLRETQNDKAAIEFLATQIKRRPSIRGLFHLVNLYIQNSHGDTRDKLRILQDFVAMLMHDKPLYQCEHCGFSGKTLFWCCPSCHKWSTVRPIQGIAGN